MKKYSFSLIALFMVTLCSAQMFVSQAEYFWDTDPGAGNGTAVQAADGNFNSAFEQLTKTGIATPGTGLHKFCIRIKDNTGAWGPVFTNVIQINAAVTNFNIVAQAEYFWDTDPGAGNGTAVLAVDGNFDNAFEKLTKTGIVLPTNGLHVFNIRIKDSSGAWGPVFRNVVNIAVPLGIDEEAKDDLIVYPNPATNVIHFNKEFAKADLFDLNGRLIKTAVSNTEINIEALAIGTYILKVTTSEGLTFNKKMIKR